MRVCPRKSNRLRARFHPGEIRLQGVGGKGGQPSVVKSELCLVLSRPCAAAHIVVAAVAKFTDSVPKSIDSFDKVLDFLTRSRERLLLSGRLLSGPAHRVEAEAGDFARLDSFHTIEIPEGDEQRTQFLATRRTLTLHPDFARDLHMRVFGAFAGLGFDDHSWPSTEDLQWLVTQGQTDIAAATLATRQLEAQKASRGAEGTQFKESELTAAQEKLAALKERVEPYERELAARQASPL